MTLSAMIATASSVLLQAISVHVVYGLGTVPKSYSKESTFGAPHEANGLECGTPYSRQMYAVKVTTRVAATECTVQAMPSIATHDSWPIYCIPPHSEVGGNIPL